VGCWWVVLGPRWWSPAGPVVGLLRSGEVQVRLLSFSVYLFSVFYFIDLNIVLNSTLFCKFD
jgi:hypothetical protein